MFIWNLSLIFIISSRQFPMTTLSPRSEFVPLGPRISLYTPEQPITGQMIIICTWLGAIPKHIAKYTDVYRGIAPGARILLIESAVPILVSSYARQRAAIVPAVTVVLAALAECSHVPLPDGNKTTDDRSNRNPSGISKPKIILHMFSNGGTNTATQFLLVLHERLRAPLPLSGMLYDSCPAKGTYWKDHRAMFYYAPQRHHQPRAGQPRRPHHSRAAARRDRVRPRKPGQPLAPDPVGRDQSQRRSPWGPVSR